MVHTVAHIHSAVRDAFEFAQKVLLRAVRERFVVDGIVSLEHLDEMVALVNVLALVVAWLRRDKEGHHDPRHSRVNATVIE